MLVVFCSMEITGLSPVILSTSGRSRFPRKLRAYAEKVSIYRRCPSAKIVSNANDDLPLPLSPVITVRLLRGISASIFLRLCTRAPYTLIYSVSSCMLIYPIVLTAKITVSPRISAEKRYFSVLKCTILTQSFGRNATIFVPLQLLWEIVNINQRLLNEND